MAFPETVLSRKLNTSLPLWQAPLPFGIIPAETSAQISASGAIGILRIGETDNCNDLARTIEAYRKHHDAPSFCFTHRLPNHPHFNSNNPQLQQLTNQYHIPYPLPEADHFLDLLELTIAATPKAIGFANGIPEKDTIDFIKSQNILTFAIVKNLLEALTAEDFGIDALVLQGSEAGGEQCGFDNDLPALELSALSLLQQVRTHTALPLILWSDYTHGADIVAAIIAGAQAVMLDRAFVQCGNHAELSQYNEYHSQINSHYTIRPMRYSINEHPIHLHNLNPAEREALCQAYFKQHPEKAPLAISSSPNQLPTTLPELLTELQQQANALIG